MKKINLKEALLVFFSILLIFLIFSYRLTKVPPGINIDESSFGYNASLLAKNLRDENNRFLPVFILTLSGKDWKPPVRMYLTAITFKLFGRSYLNFRMVSVFVAVASCLLFFLLLKLFFSTKLSLVGLFVFASSPSLLLQSHFGSDNIDVLPWIILWLYFFVQYCKKFKPTYLLLSGIFLGISFYTYKAMHAIVPVYLGISVVYLFLFNFWRKTGKKFEFLWFLLGIAPFLIPLRWLQVHYAGAIYDLAIVNRPSFYDSVYVYLSSFDFSFIFLRGDKMLIHSTGRHGIFLLPGLPLFFLGFLQLYKEKKPMYYFIFASLILTPLLFTMVGSVYRASRLLAYIPSASFIFTLGVKFILEIKNKTIEKVLLLFFFLLLSLNYSDFVRYYWYDYPKLISGDFSPNLDRAMAELKKLTLETGKNPYFEKSTYVFHKADMQFFKEVYFPYQEVKIWTREKESFPGQSFVLSNISGSGEVINYRAIPSLESGQRTMYILGK